VSVICTVNENVPGVDGVPLTEPVAASRVNPPGKAPVLMEYTKGGVPPDGEQLPEYAVPTCAAFGKSQLIVSLPGITVSGGAAWFAVCGGDPLSLACTVNENVPGVERVPLIMPVEESRLTPGGNTPELIE
jgi:hypothetical protein